MRVILLQNIPNRGFQGDLIEVPDAYAQTFLFPQALAIEATEQVIRAHHQQEQTPKRQGSAKEIAAAHALVLPGVGAFEAGMRGLAVRGLISAVQNAALENKPMLGICLGAQLLFSEGHEFGVHQGLGIIQGKVVRFPASVKEKVPQVGWNRISPPKGVSWAGSMFEVSVAPPEVYFVHSYIMEPDSREHIFGLTSYGGVEFCSIVKKGAIVGVQFHPEKSGEIGLLIIKNFINTL